MKNFFRLGLAATALMLFFNAVAVTETKAQGVLNEILKKMEAHRNALTSLRANVTMVKTDSVLKESDTYEGAASYLPAKGRDALIRIDWSKPAQESLAVVNGEYVIYRPRLQQALRGSAKDAKGGGKASGALGFMNMSKAQLQANYTVKYLGQANVAGGIPTWHLELVPKTAQKYKSAELWVDGNGMPIQAKVVENNNDTTTVLLSNLQKNVTLNASIFKIDLPKGTKIVKG
jgi:outer membrane lipoprotein-sorting protein